MRKFLAFFLFVYFIGNSFVFSKNVVCTDSLKTQLVGANDTLRVQLLHSLAECYQNDSLPACIYYATELLRWSDSLHYSRAKSDAQYLLGSSYYKESMFKEAIFYLKGAISGYEAQNEKFLLGKSCNYLGNIYCSLGDYHLGLDVHLKALKIREELGLADEISRSLNNIGNVYFSLEKYDDALVYYNRSRSIKEELEDTLGMSFVYNNIGNILNAQNRNEKAIEYYQKSLQLGLKTNDSEGVAIALGNLGSVYFQKKDYSKAIVYFKRSLKESKAINDRWGIANILNNLAEVYLETRNYNDAYNSLHEALDISMEINSLSKQMECYRSFTRLFEEKGNFKEVVRYQKLYMQVRDSIYNEHNSRAIADAQTRYQLSRIDHENELLRQQNTIHELELKREKNKWIYLLIVSGLVLILLGYALYISFFRKKHNKLLKEKNRLIYEMNQKLAESNLTKDKFLSIVAHDLKNPFNAVQGFSDLLLERYDELDDELRKEYLEIIYKSSLHGTHLLETLLEWSRSQMGVIQYKPQVFDMGQLVVDMLEELNEKALAKNIKLKSSVSRSYWVDADLNMVRTIVRNLGNNALKFTKDNGMVTIDLEEQQDWLICQVGDNGVGIRPEDQDKLFSLDSNFSTNGTSNEKGTGLGLVLCKDFVEKNGGSIGVKSKLGEGSTFWFSLPIADSNVLEKKSPTENVVEELNIS